MKIVIIGGGGQVADAIGIMLMNRGFDISFFRFKNRIFISGVPLRPLRSAKRYTKVNIISGANSQTDSFEYSYKWVNEDEIEKADVIIYSLPSYLAEYTGFFLSKQLDGKILINLSNRFLGTYSLAVSAKKSNPKFNPNVFIAFNSPPILSYQKNRDEFSKIFYQKPIVMCSCFPKKKSNETKSLLKTLFDFTEDSIRLMPSELDLSFENINSILHAVQDLENLRSNIYLEQGAGSLYSAKTYVKSMVDKTDKIVLERNLIAEKYSSEKFRSLIEFDLSTFKIAENIKQNYSDSISYRHDHKVLKEIPNPTWYNAHGYEDVGWSLTTLESFGNLANISTPHLSKLIDAWNHYTKVDYRKQGRTIKSLSLINLISAPDPQNRAFFQNWNWQFEVF